jgi:hypothetical protein
VTPEDAPDRGTAAPPEQPGPGPPPPPPPPLPAQPEHQPAPAPAFEDEVRTALSYEKGLAVKALLAIALVGVVLAARFFLLG